MPALWQENVGFGSSLHFFSDKSGVAIPFSIYSIYRNSIDYSEFNRETEKTLKEHSAIRFSRDLKIMFLSRCVCTRSRLCLDTDTDIEI